MGHIRPDSFEIVQLKTEPSILLLIHAATTLPFAVMRARTSTQRPAPTAAERAHRASTRQAEADARRARRAQANQAAVVRAPSSSTLRPTLTAEARAHRASQRHAEADARRAQANQADPRPSYQYQNIEDEDFHDMPWLFDLNDVCIWVRDSTFFVEASGETVPITYLAIWLGRLEYSPSTLQMLFNVEADPLYEDGERMVTRFGHHVSILYGPWIPARERKALKDNLNDVLQKWIYYRKHPYFRIKEILCLPTHAYIKRRRGYEYEYEERVRLTHWTQAELHEAVDMGIIFPERNCVYSDDDLDDDRTPARGADKGWTEMFWKWERDQGRFQEAEKTLTFLRDIPMECIQSQWSLLTYEKTVFGEGGEGPSYQVKRNLSPELFDMCYFVQDRLTHPCQLFRWRDENGKKRWNKKVHRIVPEPRWHVTPSNMVYFVSQESGAGLVNSPRPCWTKFEEACIAEFRDLRATQPLR